MICKGTAIIMINLWYYVQIAHAALLGHTPLTGRKLVTCMISFEQDQVGRMLTLSVSLDTLHVTGVITFLATILEHNFACSLPRT